jgi:DNA-binding CsgD family transcriptional regulator
MDKIMHLKNNSIETLVVPKNIQHKNLLTQRETTCLKLLVMGKNPAQCADMLNITYSSVITYEKRIRQKLGARNRAHAFYLAIYRGYLQIK